MQQLAKDSELMAFNHDGFWQPMDTLRDKNLLENLWQNKKSSMEKFELNFWKKEKNFYNRSFRLQGLMAIKDSY